MEWNAKTLSHGDWDNLMMFNGKTPEIPKQVQLTDWGIEGDGGIDNWSLFSSGGGVCSASDFGNGSSSKSSISVSIDSSSKGGTKISKFSLGVKKKKELGTVEDPQISTTLGASVDSGEPLIGLKLGKRTYFEDVCAGSTSKPTSLSVTPATSATTTKRSRSSYLTPHCQVEGCNLDLSSSKEYHRRHRVCENHAKCPRVIVAGLVRRFCQQCSRFHDLVEFDEKKRSCRRRLSDHNARRRKPLPEAIQFNSPRLPSSFYDGSPHMSLVLNRIPPPVHTSPAANPTWERSCGSSQAKGSLLKSSKGGIDGQMHLPIVDLPNTISTLCHESDRLFPFKGSTSEVLNQGLEVPVIPSNEDATPDFWRALSLLSNGSWGSGDPEPTSLNRLMHVNHVNTVRPSMHVVSQGYPLTPSEHLHAQQRQTESRMHSSTFQNNGSSQFQQFQLFKTPYESGFYSNQLN